MRSVRRWWSVIGCRNDRRAMAPDQSGGFIRAPCDQQSRQVSRAGAIAMATPFKVGELDHVVVRCLDEKRAYDFYTQELGLVEERRLDALGLIQLRAGASL